MPQEYNQEDKRVQAINDFLYQLSLGVTKQEAFQRATGGVRATLVWPRNLAVEVIPPPGQS